jgi:hypothetical protein
MPSYNFKALALSDYGFQKPCKSLKTSVASEVAKAFVGNMDRVAALPLYPIKLLIAQEGYGKAVNREVTKLTGESYPDILMKNRDKYLAARRLAEATLGQIPLEEMQALEAEVMSRASLDEWARTEAAMALCNPYLGKAIEAVLSGMAIGTWTAFETLAGDLWVTTLNAHPRGLDRLAGHEKRIHEAAKMQRAAHAKDGALPPDKPNVRRQEGEKEISIKAIHDVTRGGYDLSSRMGELLRGKVDFTTIWDTRRAYSLAFDDRKVGRSVTAAVDAALANPALDALAQVRNVLVHKAGVADADYEMHRATLPTMPQVAEGKPVQLNGDAVKNLVEPVVACCVKLLEAVDVWLDTESMGPERNPGAGI